MGEWENLWGVQVRVRVVGVAMVEPWGGVVRETGMVDPGGGVVGGTNTVDP